MGPHGFLIACKGCGKTCDSKGLRCCSHTCEKRYREREDNLATMAEAGMDKPVKRKCLHCAGDIPNWRKGRRVSATTKFCSDRCKRRHVAERCPSG